MIEVLFDAIKDSFILLPFIFLIYVFMELIEDSKNGEKIERALKGRYAPIVASFSGVVPECGFSVMCAKLYDNGLIRVGTLIAVFLSASDEGLVVILSNPQVNVRYLVLLIVYKIVFASLIGIILNKVLFNFGTKHICPVKDSCVSCGEKHVGFYDKYILHTLSHATKTFTFILCFNVILSLIIFFIGEDKISAFVISSKPYQPLVSATLGLLPTCASSTIIAHSFCEGVLSFSGLIAGLASNAGVGLVVLFKNRKKIKENVVITLILYGCAVLMGYVAFLSGI